VEGFNIRGERLVIKTKSKMLAVILQHELDHLAGITLRDRGKPV
jgi:peptide deformylase